MFYHIIQKITLPFKILIVTIFVHWHSTLLFQSMQDTISSAYKIFSTLKSGILCDSLRCFFLPQLFLLPLLRIEWIVIYCENIYMQFHQVYLIHELYLFYSFSWTVTSIYQFCFIFFLFFLLASRFQFGKNKIVNWGRVGKGMWEIWVLEGKITKLVFEFI